MKLAAKIRNHIKIRQDAERYTHDLPSLMMAAEKTAAHILHGPHAQRKAGSGENFWQFREYQTSDRPQDIDWRHSAKGDTTYTRQKELQKAAQTFIWCESGRAMAFKSEKALPYSKQETAHILGLSCALLLKRSEEQFGLFGDPKAGNSEKMLQKIASAFIEEQKRTMPLPDVQSTSLPRNANMIAFGSFLAPIEEITDNFNDLRAKTSRTCIVQILDPAEVGLTYSGRIRFEGLHNVEHTIDHVPSIRAAYKEKITTHIESIKSLCAQLGWVYYLHVTDQPLNQSLVNISEMLNTQREA